MAIQDNTAYGYDDSGGQHSLRDLLTTVFKRRRLIVAFAVSVVTVVMLVTLLLPRKYEVAATLLVNKARAEIPIAPSEAPQFIVNQVSEQDLNSEIEVLKSRKLIEDVLRTIGANEAPESESSVLGSALGSVLGTARKLVGGAALSPFDAMVVELQKEIQVYTIRKSNVIRLSLASTDPEWATRVIGTLTDKYLGQRAERYQSPQAVSFFEQQMADAEQRLKDQENVLESFVEEASLTMVRGPQGSDSLAAQKALVMDRLARLESDLGDGRVKMQEESHRIATLRDRLASEPPRLESASRFNQDAANEEIEKGLASLRLQRDALLQDFRPDSRHVRDIDTQIRLAEERLHQAEGDRMGVDGTENNPVYLDLKGELLRAEAELEGTRARITSLNGQVGEYRQVLDRLNENSFEIDRMRREAQAAEDDYLLYRKKHEEARISAAMDQEKFINVTIAQPAQIPLKPVPRGLLLKLFLSVFIGVLGGVGLAFGFENFLDRSFTTAEEIERKLGIPHIASIPEGEMVG
jgi:succinoglycan biosynthesis transport protein ExoP